MIAPSPWRRAVWPLGLALLTASMTLLPTRPPSAAGHFRGAATEALAPMPPPSADATALLGGLRVGDWLGAFRVVRLTGPRARKVLIDVEGGGAVVTLLVTAHGTDSHRPPRSTKHYDIFYDTPDPSLTGATLGPVLEALGNRVALHEEEVRKPPGM